MPKDPARNRDRYAIRGGQLNEFDFNQQHGEISQQQNAPGQGPQGADETSGLPPDQAKAARTRALLAAHGEGVAAPEQPSLLEEPKAPRPVHDIEGDKAKVASARSKPTPKRSREEIETMAAARRAGDKVPGKASATTSRTTKSSASNQGATRGATKTAATSQQAKPAAASKTASQKSAKQATARKGAQPAPASKGAGRTSAQQNARPAAARKSAAQPAARNTAKQTAAKKATKQTAAPARKAAANKSGATKARTTGRTTAAPTRAGSSKGRQR